MKRVKKDRVQPRTKATLNLTIATLKKNTFILEEATTMALFSMPVTLTMYKIT
jgi:hypothetical protein